MMGDVYVLVLALAYMSCVAGCGVAVSGGLVSTFRRQCQCTRWYTVRTTIGSLLTLLAYR